MELSLLIVLLVSSYLLYAAQAASSSSTPSYTWYNVISNQVNDATFYYDSNVWFNSSALNGNCAGCFSGTTARNAKTSFYSTIYVQKIKVTMAGSVAGVANSYDFDLPSYHAGKFTLMDLVTMDGGVALKPSGSSWVGFVHLYAHLSLLYARAYFFYT